MKFSIFFVLAGLCAFSSASTDLKLFEGIPEVQFIEYEPLPTGVQDELNKFIQKYVDKMNSVIGEFKALVKGDQQAIEIVAQEAQVQAQSKIDEVMNKIRDLTAKGGKMARCAFQHETEMVDITNGVSTGIKECVTEIAAALKDLTLDIVQSSDGLLKAITELKDLAMYCFSKPSKVLQGACIATRMLRFKSLFTTIIGEAKAVVEKLQVKGQVLINAVKACNENHIQTTLVKVENVKTAVLQCYNNN